MSEDLQTINNVFCSGCGKEVDDGENFCIHCGKELSKYQKKSSSVEEHLENNVYEEYEEIPTDNINNENEDSETKIQNLIDVISRLQAENLKLKRELEDYRQDSPITKSDNQFGRMKPRTDEKDDIFTKFKKWYNE